MNSPSKLPSKTVIALKKALRYFVFFPLDMMRSVPIFVACLALRVIFLGHRPPASLFANLFVVLYAFKWPPKTIRGALAALYTQSNVNEFIFVLSFFMWPFELEKKILGNNSIEAHHWARVKLIQTELPLAHNVIDVGGSCGGIPEGALLHMGYPHPLQSLTIVDLPPEIQFWAHERRQDAENVPHVIASGTKIFTRYSPMSNLSAFADHSVDGVWAGQSVEHVSPEELQQTMREVQRVLKNEGWFCFDTPNGLLTKKLCRVGFVHPEHKREYLPNDLEQMARAQGFEVRKSLAVSPMPISKALGLFCKYELIYGAPLSNNADEGFSFFCETRKVERVRA